MEAKQVSIIIPVYQAGVTLERCVHSIVAGNYQNIEIILIDDCSTDGSSRVALELQRQYPQVVCLRNDRNSGVSATRNKGLDAAHGDYLMFVDSDDWVETDFVSSMMENVQEGVMPVCGYVNHDERKNGRTDIFGWSESAAPRRVKLCDGLDELYRNRLLQMLWNKVFVAEIVKKHDLRFDTSIHCGEDFRFLLEYLQCARTTEFAFVPQVLYHYSRDNEHSLATRFTEIALEEPLRNIRLMYELMGKSQTEIDALLVQEKTRQLMRYAYGYMHDVRLEGREKKRLICALPLENPKKVYRDMWILYLKERISGWLKKRN